LLDLNQEQLKAMLAAWGEPAYRTDQVWAWVYRDLSADFGAMTNLPRALREKLEAAATLNTLNPLATVSSSDGTTRKALFALRDGETIETVLMGYRRRRTVCISTQAGCPVGCPFCATGQSGFARNLSQGEIVEQVLHFARELKRNGESLTNVVFMGMGEPFANYDAVWQAVEALTNPAGFGLGARHLTISTSGLVPGIERLSREKKQVRLAISLHSVDDGLRDELVPVNRKWPLAELREACRAYIECTGRRISFEWALIDKVNDSLSQARALARWLRGLTCHVNLIPLNPTGDYHHGPSPRAVVLGFRDELVRHGIPCTVRLDRGLDIQAGCGQLRRRMRRQDTNRHQ